VLGWGEGGWGGEGTRTVKLGGKREEGRVAATDSFPFGFPDPPGPSWRGAWRGDGEGARGEGRECAPARTDRSPNGFPCNAKTALQRPIIALLLPFSLSSLPRIPGGFGGTHGGSARWIGEGGGRRRGGKDGTSPCH